MDPTCSLFTTGNVWNPTCWRRPVDTIFFHQYSIAVLMANARGNDALWDEHDRLIVRRSCSVLLVGQRSSLVGAIIDRYARLFFGLEHAMLRIIDQKPAVCGRIVEVASVDYRDGKNRQSAATWCVPIVLLVPQAMAIHRITEAMVADKPWIEDGSRTIR